MRMYDGSSAIIARNGKKEEVWPQPAGKSHPAGSRGTCRPGGRHGLGGSEQCPSGALTERTRQRIQAAAQELNYRPNFLARSLRKKRTYTVGLIIEEIGDAYGSLVISGIEAYLRQHNYFFLTVIH